MFCRVEDHLLHQPAAHPEGAVFHGLPAVAGAPVELGQELLGPNDGTRDELLNLPEEVPCVEFRQYRAESEWPQVYDIK